MTLDEFLGDYVPNVLKPMGKWRIRGGSIRRSNGLDRCPLVAKLEDIDEWRPSVGGKALGLLECDYAEIAAAADSRDHPLRSRLLAGLGLTERS